ncbi:hypothetical protein Gotur_015637, partial [Gossypium turneri]
MRIDELTGGLVGGGNRGVGWNMDDLLQLLVHCQGTNMGFSNRATGSKISTSAKSRGFAFVAFRDKKTTRDTTEGITGQNIDGRNIPWERAVYFEEETVGTTAVEEAEDLVVSKEAMTAEAVMVMVTQETALRRKSNRK